jgi:PPOX class probable F420-dependent enzyme
VLDEKPKQVPDDELGRVRNIRRHPPVCLTIDRYDEDWTRLAYIQIRGIARIVVPEEAIHASSLEVLRAKYMQYQAMDLTNRSVIALTEPRIRVWRASNNA